MAIIGLDMGTTGTKAVVFSESGAILCSAYREYDIVKPRPGWYELNTSVIWQSAKEVLREVASLTTEPIKAIGTSSLGESFFAFDENDNILGNSPIYLDTRGEEYLPVLEDKMGTEAIMRETGHTPMTMYTMTKFMHMRDNEPERWARTKRIHFIADGILYLLGAEQRDGDA